jgi:hypothetical protein
MNRGRWGKWIEILLPWAVAATAAILGLIRSERIQFALDVKIRLLDKLVDVCSISVGFWATALALLLALEGRETVDGLRKIGIYNRIVGYFLITVYSFLFLLLLCLATIAFGRPLWLPRNVYLSGWSFVVTLSASTMLRSFWILGKLLKAK